MKVAKFNGVMNIQFLVNSEGDKARRDGQDGAGGEPARDTAEKEDPGAVRVSVRNLVNDDGVEAEPEQRPSISSIVPDAQSRDGVEPAITTRSPVLAPHHQSEVRTEIQNSRKRPSSESSGSKNSLVSRTVEHSSEEPAAKKPRDTRESKNSRREHKESSRKRERGSRCNSPSPSERNNQLARSGRKPDVGVLIESSSLAGRGVKRFFGTQITQAWNSLSGDMQKALLSLSVFPSSFSMKAAISVQGAVNALSHLTGSEIASKLASTSILTIDSVTGRCELNSRVRGMLHQKVSETGFDLTGSKQAFVKFTMNELESFEKQSRQADTMRSYMIATQNFELESANILRAFDVAGTDQELYGNNWLRGAYLLRYTLDAESRVKIYKKAIENMARRPRSNSREDMKYSARLLLAYGRANLDAMRFDEANEPLLASNSVLTGLLGSAVSATERSELYTELIVIKQSLARLKNELGEYEEALKHIMECIKARRANSETGSVPYALCLGVLAETLYNLRDYSNSMKVVEEQLGMLEKNKMEDSHEYANALNLIGKILLAEKNGEKAADTLINALERLQRSSLPYRNYGYLEGRILEDLGITVVQQGKDSYGARALQLAIRAYSRAGFKKKKAEVEKLMDKAHKR